MKKASVEKLEQIAAAYLQRLYSRYAYYRKTYGVSSSEAARAWSMYVTSCSMLNAFGASWNRYFIGEEETREIDATQHVHKVKFPTDAQCEKMDISKWGWQHHE